jgi:DNA polymerase II large subunit
MTLYNFEEKFNKTIDYFRLVKKNGADFEKDIASTVINDPIKKMTFLIKNQNLENWLLENFYKHKRENLYKLVCDKFLDNSFGVTDTLTICEQAIRTVLAIATEGVVSTPLEGISEVYIGLNKDGSKYIGIKYAGPIRAAGGTAAGLTVLVGCYLSKKLGFKYIVEKEEIERYMTETAQYLLLHPPVLNPTNEQIKMLVDNIIVCVDGVAAEKELVNEHRYLNRVSTPYIRGGAILILCALILKSKKLLLYENIFEIELSYLLEIYNKSNFTLANTTSSFVDSVVAGRAVFSMPRLGGFRLRIGRSRNTGLGTQGISPYTMKLLKFLNVGSQMMTSTPGKANSVVPVTDLQGPTIELINGSVKTIMCQKDYDLYTPFLKQILDTGELLVTYGEFLENNIKLKSIDHSNDYWRQKYQQLPFENINENVRYCYDRGILLHPNYAPITVNYPLEMWSTVRAYLINNKIDVYKPFKIDNIILNILKTSTINYNYDRTLEFDEPIIAYNYYLLNQPIDLITESNLYETLLKHSNLKFPKKGSIQVGTRLASVEAASITEVGTGINLVYKIKSSKYKTFQKYSYQVGKQITLSKPTICIKCNIISVQQYCTECNNLCNIVEDKLIETEHNLVHDLSCAAKKLAISIDAYDIRVTNNLDRTDKWEPFEKGILRAKYKLSVFKDGTIRFSVSNVTLTQFKPSEINVSIDKLKNLGYLEDIYGQPLIKPQQICNLKIYDVILPIKFVPSIIAVTKFIDELLVKYYYSNPYHKIKILSDCIGLEIGIIAPHILNGTCGRIIGFADINAMYCHPLATAARRRNADGDKDLIVVLSDLLLNFSNYLLKNGNGRYMNVFSILSTKIYIDSIDKEVTNVDIMKNYPLELYESLNIENDNITVDTIKIVKKGFEESTMYEYSTPTDIIHLSNSHNAYKDLETIEEKIDQQLDLSFKIYSVDLAMVLKKVIEGHLIKDIVGNCRRFLTQNYRCTSCNIVYEVCFLDGNCMSCKQRVNYTVHPRSVLKYIPLLIKYRNMFSKYMSPYLISAIEQTINEANSLVKSDEILENNKLGFKKFL